MTAHAVGGVAEATAGAQDFESEPGATTGDVQTRSYSVFNAGVLKSVSSCTASDLGFADGAVTIGSVRTEAEASTDGTSSLAGGRTVVSGMKVAGQAAEVDENGVRFTDPATAPIGEQVLSNFGISMFVASPRTQKGASSASHRAGSLVVLWDPPGTDYGYAYDICGSEVAVELRTGLAFQPTPPTLPPIDPPPTFVAEPVYSPPPSYRPDAPTTVMTVPARPRAGDHRAAADRLRAEPLDLALPHRARIRRCGGVRAPPRPRRRPRASGGNRRLSP